MVSVMQAACSTSRRATVTWRTASSLKIMPPSPSLVPALGNQSHLRRGRLPRPRRRPSHARRRGGRRWGCDAGASAGGGSVGRRGNRRPHLRRRCGGVADLGLGYVGRGGPGVGRTQSKTSVRSSPLQSSPSQVGIRTLIPYSKIIYDIIPQIV